MQQSDSGGLEEVGRYVAQLEESCNEIEISIRASDWNRLGEALRTTRRAMHAFENAIAETHQDRDAEFDRAIFARLQRVYAVRDEQLRRIMAIHDGIGERLRALSRWKQYARAVGRPPGARAPALFQYIR
ncbi:MAG: hypothetical protein M3R51_03015 [Candidatus Eremiobacteraeota bacterium]|nr:hypothetical protein [Candidatus Eremiobacteraeota bacterium]